MQGRGVPGTGLRGSDQSYPDLSPSCSAEGCQHGSGVQLSAMYADILRRDEAYGTYFQQTYQQTGYKTLANYAGEERSASDCC